MARCSNGHDSATADYCDVCGVPMGTPPRAEPATAAAAAAAACGSCGQPMLAGARFCELCGWDAEAAKLGGDPTPEPAAGPEGPEITLTSQPAPAAPTGTGWHVVVAADRSYFDTVLAMDGADAGDLSFPTYWPERRFPLSGQRVVIGRHSRSRGTDPDIDLGGQFVDPGVSHLHAMLAAQSDGTWAVVDLGSSNGTYLNHSTDPLKPHIPVTVADGDEIHVGAWTTLTLRAG
jgi:FHA domain-containing protein